MQVNLSNQSSIKVFLKQTKIIDWFSLICDQFTKTFLCPVPITQCYLETIDTDTEEFSS